MHALLFSDALSRIWNWPAAGWLPVLAASQAEAQQLATLAVTALWQGALVALGLAVCLRLAPSTPAAHRFLLWSSGFAALVALSIWPFFSGRIAVAPYVAAPSAAPGPLLQLDLRWSLPIAVLWLALTAWRAIDLLIHLAQLRGMYRTATPVADASLTASSTLAHKHVEVCLTPSLQRPCVIGFFAPRILIPDWLYYQLTPQELDQILRHEREHLRRGDDWTNLFQKLCLLVFPLNPALLWIERRLCQEREMACDDGVVAATHAPRAYAECLARLAEHALRSRTEALSLGFGQHRPELVRRVQSLLLRNRPAGPLATFATLGLLACGLLAGSIELARCPQLIAFVPTARPIRQAAPATTQAHLQPTALALPAHPSRQRASAPHAALSANGQASAAARPPQPSQPDGSGAVEFADAVIPDVPGHPVIVLSRLDGFPLPASAVQIISDFATGSDSTPEWPAPFSHPAAGQVTITRLFVRILPAADVYAHPAVDPERGSWFVFQL